MQVSRNDWYYGYHQHLPHSLCVTRLCGCTFLSRVGRLVAKCQLSLLLDVLAGVKPSRG